MAKKETVKITPEGLNLLTVLSYSGIAEMNGFSGKEVFFTEAFAGDLQYLFQALGNLGAFARKKDFEKDIDVVVVSNEIIENPESPAHTDFVVFFEEKLNQNNSPFRRIRFISEDHLVWYFENRIKITTDTQLPELIKKYKESKKLNAEQKLF